MYDLHCHILPELDDGAQSTEETIAMARKAAESGTQEIVCTPHCSSNDPRLPLRLEAIVSRTEEMNKELQAQGIPITLHYGMELLCLGQLWDLFREGEFLTLAGSRYLLMEFPFLTRGTVIEQAAESAVQAGLCPVLAHPERYRCVQRTPERVKSWVNAGWVIQVNRGSITGGLGPDCQECAHWLLQQGLAQLVASDAHSPMQRSPDLSKGFAWVSENISPADAWRLFYDNPRRIIQDRPVVLHCS